MLIEVLITVAIMTILTAAVAFAVIPMWGDMQKKTARLNAAALRRIAGNFRMGHSGEECPTFAQLRAERLVDKGTDPTDPWGSPYEIICADDDVTVVSPGPDKKTGTADDIIAPQEKAAPKDR
jgi:hypothetical protein